MDDLVIEWDSARSRDEILDVATFYPIKGNESYHQDFYKKSPIRYTTYRWGCGRDKRLREIWGDDALGGK